MTDESTTPLGEFPTTPTWCVDSVEPAGIRRLRISGWLVRPNASTATIIVNGKSVGVVERDRVDLGAVLIGDGNVARGFEIVTRDAGSRGLEMHLAIDAAPAGTSAYYYPPRSQRGDLPPPAARTRVHGSAAPASFLLEGYSAYRGLAAVALERCTPATPGARLRLLDWGCGCGRVARYFVEDKRFDVIGVDIDRDNVSWCSEHLAGTYYPIVPDPPMEIEDESFDVIVGVSVMTHLTFDYQQEWLAEMRRLLRPGGVALLTTHGWHTARRTGLTEVEVQRFGSTAFLDGGVNPNIPTSVVFHGYYRNVLNTPASIRAGWSPVLEVEDIAEGSIGGHQDLVVLRRER